MALYYIWIGIVSDIIIRHIFKELTELPIHSIYSIDYEPIPQDVALKTLEDKLMGVENTIAKQQDKRNKRGAFSSDMSYKVRRKKRTGTYA